VARVKLEGIHIESLVLVGHADRLNSTGKQDYNQQLSQKRVNTVRNLLGETGFNESRIQRVTAYADRRNRSVNPMDPNNNRIEVILLR
jgi:chemotaxis protein MotB